MARACIIFGLLLCGLTIGVLVVSSLKNPAHFIPMMLGIPILFCGVVGLNPHRLATSLRFALAIALAGGLLGASRIAVCLVRLSGERPVNLFALKLVCAMTALCLIFAVTCLFFLLRTRRRKTAAGGVFDANGTSD